MSTSAQPTQYFPSVSRDWRGIAVQIAAGLAALTREMSFVEHLEELRRRLIWSVMFIGAAFGLCWFAAADLLEIASAPIRAANPEVPLSLFRAQDIVGLYVKVTLVASLFLSAPFVLMQAWLFISPGLYPHERRYAVPFVLFASVLFLAGGAFGYFIAFPTALRFLLAWIVESHLTPIIDFGEYLTLFLTIVVALGLSFQIPAIVFVLSRIGLVNARFLAREAQIRGLCVRRARRHPDADHGSWEHAGSGRPDDRSLLRRDRRRSAIRARSPGRSALSERWRTSFVVRTFGVRRRRRTTHDRDRRRTTNDGDRFRGCRG